MSRIWKSSTNSTFCDSVGPTNEVTHYISVWRSRNGKCSGIHGFHAWQQSQAKLFAVPKKSKHFFTWIFAQYSMGGLNICPEEPCMRFNSAIFCRHQLIELYLYAVGKLSQCSQLKAMSQTVPLAVDSSSLNLIDSFSSKNKFIECLSIKKVRKKIKSTPSKI